MSATMSYDAETHILPLVKDRVPLCNLVNLGLIDGNLRHSSVCDLMPV